MHKSCTFFPAVSCIQPNATFSPLPSPPPPLNQTEWTNGQIGVLDGRVVGTDTLAYRDAMTHLYMRASLNVIIGNCNIHLFPLIRPIPPSPEADQQKLIIHRRHRVSRPNYWFLPSIKEAWAFGSAEIEVRNLLHLWFACR